MFERLFGRLAVYLGVVKICKCGLAYEDEWDDVHSTSERSRLIAKSDGYSKKSVRFVVCGEGCLILAVVLELDFLASADSVYCGEDGFLAKRVDTSIHA